MSLEADVTNVKRLIEARPVFKPASPVNLVKREEEINKQFVNSKIITIEAEYFVPVAALIEEIMHSEWDQVDYPEVRRMLTSSGLKWVRDEITTEIGSLPIQILKLKFIEADSSNLSHAGAYYKVKLRGPEGALRRIANEDSAIYYEWPLVDDGFQYRPA